MRTVNHLFEAAGNLPKPFFAGDEPQEVLVYIGSKLKQDMVNTTIEIQKMPNSGVDPIILKEITDLVTKDDRMTRIYLSPNESLNIECTGATTGLYVEMTSTPRTV